MTRFNYLFSALLICISAGCVSTDPGKASDKSAYDIVKRAITVDADISDWEDVAINRVEGREHLWYGQGMTPEKWKGNADHSY
ncbi:MAG: hypothetical protein DRP64_08215, partial [Verrucomicrobia bacterium]